MSHYTTMVVFPREPKDRDDLDGMLAEALAPFDENAEVEPYKSHDDPLPADWRERLPLYRKAARAMRSLRPEKGRVPDKHREAWEVCRDLYQANKIPWPYSALLPEDDSEPPNLGDLHLVAKLFNEQWDGDYGVDDKGLFKWSTYNPKSKWDWWCLGGRWLGYFQVRPRAVAFGGEAGAFGNKKASTPDARPADACRKGDVDTEAMRRAKVLKAEDWWAEAQAKPGDASFVYDVQEGETREEYIARKSDIAELLRPFAVLHEGRWAEAGKMGWFGCDSSTEETRKVYADWFAAFWDDLPDDTWVAVCDLHI